MEWPIPTSLATDRVLDFHSLCRLSDVAGTGGSVRVHERLSHRLAVLKQTPAQLAAFALTLATVIDVSRLWPPIAAADPDDDLFILCAAAAHADYLVTADRHLLALGKYQGIPIVQLDDFLRRITA